MLGALFIWLGIWYYKGAGGRAGSNPHYISVELSRKAGVFFVICGAIIIVCGFVVKPEGNTSGSSANTVTKTNTCQSCGGSPYAYFVQVGNKIQCQNCGNLFAIDDLDNLTPDGCNPIGIEERTDKDGKITIGTEQLKQLKNKFENWKGPKA